MTTFVLVVVIFLMAAVIVLLGLGLVKLSKDLKSARAGGMEALETLRQRDEAIGVQDQRYYELERAHRQLQEVLEMNERHRAEVETFLEETEQNLVEVEAEFAAEKAAAHKIIGQLHRVARELEQGA